MRLLELGGKTFSLPVGEVALGSDASCAIPLTGAGILPRHAILRGQADGQVIIRKASPAADVLINGVRLGAEPTPLLHGDKVEVGGHELTLVDERRSGSTQFVSKVQLPETPAQAEAGAKPRVTGNTGGRVVSLTDGREYVITGPSLVFGRDAECDVVVSGKDVSRRHAEIVQTPTGYQLVDSSTNGTFVNDERVHGQRILQRVDVIRMGDEQFRFYADVLAEPPSAPAGAAERLKRTVHGVQTVPRPSGPSDPPSASGAPQHTDLSRPPEPSDPLRPLASFLVRRGGLKGHRLQVRAPVVNIGRADYNDLVLPDPSVSTAHAKVQRREGVWILLDLDSTNGTSVDGDPVKGETPIAPGAIVRFGEVELVFEPTDDAVGVAKGGGTQLLKTPQSLAVFSAPAPPKPPVPAAPVPKAAKPVAPLPPRPPPGAPASPPSPQPHAKPKPPAKARPAGKRAVAQTPEKKGKGCGASAAVFTLGAAGLVAILQRFLP
jgi:pSer/pThr/pTyr-binding forkhead associated (FHA) protein